jgi:hypothetical protein
MAGIGDGAVLSFCLWAVVASEKGVVVGRLRFREDGDQIDCQRMGVGGKAIPPNVDKVRKDRQTDVCLALWTVSSCSASFPRRAAFPEAGLRR